MILITDDSKSMREIIKFTLTLNNYKSCEAANGVEALKKAKEEKISLFLVDCNMPEMNGFDFVKELKKINEYRFSPILFLSTETDIEKKKIAKQIGATGWITKPFNPETLISTIKKFINQN